MNEITVVDFHPNGYGEKLLYSYSGCLKTVVKKKRKGGSGINGWLFNYFDFGFGKHSCVIFGREQMIFIDYGCGPKNLSDGQFEIYQKRWVMFVKQGIRFNNGEVVSLDAFVPPWRYLSNDGMFPDEVEPLYSVLKRINGSEEERHGIEKFLNTGKRV